MAPKYPRKPRARMVVVHFASVSDAEPFGTYAVVPETWIYRKQGLTFAFWPDEMLTKTNLRETHPQAFHPEERCPSFELTREPKDHEYYEGNQA
jgi:hypothetical protein